jgi:hypothetical protein
MYSTSQSIEITADQTVSKHIFFPERGDDDRPGKRICSTCPVKAFCLEYAIEAGEKHGIWGGTSERQRRSMRRERRHPLQAGIQLALLVVVPIVVVPYRRKRQRQLSNTCLQLVLPLVA